MKLGTINVKYHYSEASVMFGRQKEEGQSKGRDSRVPARGPGQRWQISSEFLPLYPNPLLSLREVDKYPNFILFQLETRISNTDIYLPSSPRKQTCVLMQGEVA